MSLMSQKLEEIAKLNELRERGIITDTEFETQKQQMFTNQPVQSSNVMSSMDLINAYKFFWKKSFVLKGRACLSEYWYPALINFLIYSMLNFLCGFSDFFEIFVILFSVIIFIPGTTVLVRRIHDTGHNAKFLLVPFGFIGFAIILSIVVELISFAGGNVDGFRLLIFFVSGFICLVLLLCFGIVSLVFACMPSELKENKYGNPYFG